MDRRTALRGLAALGLPLACGRGRRSFRDGSRDGKVQLVLKYQPLGEQETLRKSLDVFGRLHGVEVVTEALPNASDLAHQFFLTALEGGARDFDVFIVDIVWIREFARAGWLLDLSDAFAPSAIRRDFLSGVAEAVIVAEKTFAVPWYLDVGVLYRRKDLVERAPRTYAELVELAQRGQRDHSPMQGYVWQGRQYEGLVCNVFETIWGHGGVTLDSERVLLDTREARSALAYMRSLIERGISPASVTSSAEEETRRVFQDGRALFMRNWPYAWREAARPDSRLLGKVDISPLPTQGGDPGHGVLGGYELAVNAHVAPEKRDAALALVSHLTSAPFNLNLAGAYSRCPARRDVYDDPRLAEWAPLMPKLLPMLEEGRPRPLTPYYAMISDTVQGELSAAVAGIRAPEEALGRAQVLVDHIIGASR